MRQMVKNSSVLGFSWNLKPIIVIEGLSYELLVADM
jgi:hypothetical protein